MYSHFSYEQLKTLYKIQARLWLADFNSLNNNDDSIELLKYFEHTIGLVKKKKKMGLVLSHYLKLSYGIVMMHLY